MKVLIMLDIETPNLHPPKGLRGEDADMAAEEVESEKQSIIDGFTSVDMQNAMAECLASWYLSLMTSDVDVSIADATEVLPSKDRRKLRSFKLSHGGAIRQEGV